MALFTCRVVIWYLGSSGLDAATYMKLFWPMYAEPTLVMLAIEGTEASTEDIQDGTGQGIGFEEEEVGRREEMHTSGQLTPGSSACNVTELPLPNSLRNSSLRILKMSIRIYLG